MDPRISLILPSYNDAERVARSCRTCSDYIKAHSLSAEIIVVDDGSDPSRAVQPRGLPSDVRLLRNSKNLGKGGALRRGVAAARGEKILYTDSDLPFGLEPIQPTLDLLEQGYDIVMGDRLHPQSRCETNVRLARRLSSVVFTFLVNSVIGLAFRDTQCGFKGYRAEAAKRLYGTGVIDSFAFDVELLLIAVRRRYRIISQPVRLLNNETTTVRLGRHGREIILDLIRIKVRDLLGSYR
jgi:dolichyl-phosphate beta-glucosyltransferase